MKQITLDLRMWAHPGIGRYVRELIRQLIEIPGTERYRLLGDPAALAEFAFRERIAIRRGRSQIYSVAEQWEIALGAVGSDLLHVPHFNIPLMHTGRLVATVHDLLYLHDAKASRSKLGQTYTKFLLNAIARKAAAVITVSEYTRRDFLDRFPRMTADRVFVIPEAASPIFTQKISQNDLTAIRIKYGLRRPFVLFVGTLKPHKNVSLIIQAMRVLREDRKLPHELVLVGKKDARNNVLLSDILEQGSWVRYLGELSDEELPALYHLAEAFVFPSLWEGFGLPILEAMACGCPVIASDKTSLPELVEGAGLLFDPTRVDALIEPLYNVLQNKELRKKMGADGLERASKYSWKKTAEETLNVYRRVLS